jgi:NTE family protein
MPILESGPAGAPMTGAGLRTADGGAPGRPPEKIDLVLEGGGVKGIALVGAVCALADQIEMQSAAHGEHLLTLDGGRVAGTSVGAVVGCLLAAGYRPGEIRDITFGAEISEFSDLSPLSRVPLVGKPLDVVVGLLTELGMFRGDYLLGYLRGLLAKKNVRTFKDLVIPGKERETNPLERYRAHFVASDITHGRMLILPDDMSAEKYGVDPDDLEVALAVRMSMSVPFVFRPVELTGKNGVTSYIVDGGLLSNFPVRIFGAAMDRSASRTLGIRIVPSRYHAIHAPFKALFAAYAIASTALEAHDVSDTVKAIDREQGASMVYVDTSPVSVLRFGLSQLDREKLYDMGYEAMTLASKAFTRGVEIARVVRGEG